MSTLKMVLPVEVTLETTIQENLSISHKFARKISVEFRYSQMIFFVVHINFTYDSETYDLMNHYLQTLHEFWCLQNLNCTHCILIKVSPS